MKNAGHWVGLREQVEYIVGLLSYDIHRRDTK